MEALRQFQLKSSKSYKSINKPAAENLGIKLSWKNVLKMKLNKIEGLALKMIKKRRSLFEHGKLLN